MTQTENEKELILGNKQLITLFFLVVAMCGAFFAFGYIIGRNGAKTAVAAAAAPDTGAAAGSTTSPAPASETPAENPPVASATPAAADEAPPTGPETKPAQDSPSTTTPFSGQPPRPAASVSAAPNAAAPVPLAKTLEPGATYLQVTALRKSDADNLVKTLRELNLPALTAESSKSVLLRVLVGPYHQMTDVADAKAKLKSLGFANAFVQK